MFVSMRELKVKKVPVDFQELKDQRWGSSHALIFSLVLYVFTSQHYTDLPSFCHTGQMFSSE